MTLLMNTAVETATLGALALNAWHHAGWPIALRAITRLAPAQSEPRALPRDALPAITIVMPAYNEAEHIAAKLRNLAALDYPAERLRVLLACDGCSDATAAIARATLAEPDCAHLDAIVIEHTRNRGKVAVLNGTFAAVRDDIVVVTDISAMLPADALSRVAAHFADPRLGAVGGTYRLTKAGSQGEDKYWRYQIAVKRGEAALGAPLGLHGAFYAFRREAWAPLPADTINDDFVLPLEILGRGWRVAYDEKIVALEEEVSNPLIEHRRRKRIAAGNAQQLARLLWLLSPTHGGVALAFASGKALRVLAPFLIVMSLLGALALSPTSSLFAALAVLQVGGLLAAAAGALLGAASPKPLALAHYVLSGHLASGLGVMRYCAGLHRQPWRRAAAA